MDLNTRLEGSLKDRFTDYLEDQDETSKYQASRELIDDGLRRHGYHPSESSPESTLERYVTHLANAFAISGLILTGVSFSGQPGVQTYTLAVFVLAFTLYAANRLAGDHLKEFSLSSTGGDSA